MFFTRLGRILAILALALGSYNIVVGLMIATETIGPYEATLTRYFGRVSSSGQVIDKGINTVIFAIALGILTELRYALRDKQAALNPPYKFTAYVARNTAAKSR